MSEKADPMSIVMANVLLVDDEAAQLEVTMLNLKSADPQMTVTSVLKPSEALLLLRHQPFDCIVSDYQMPEMDGVHFCAEVRKTSKIPFIIYTARGSEEIASTAFLVGVDDYVRKEPSLAHYSILAKRIRHVVEKRRVEDALKASVQALVSANENLRKSEEDLLIFNEKLLASEEALRTSNEELSMSNEELSATEEELRVANDAAHEWASKLESIVKERTARLDEVEQRLRRFMDASEDGFILLDSEQRLIEVNRVALEAMQFACPSNAVRSDFLGKRYSDIFPDSENSKRYDAVNEVLRTKETLQWDEVNWVDPVIWHTNTVFPVGSGVGIIFRNISKQMQLIVEHQRSEMMSDIEGGGETISNDLRKPLDQIVQSIKMIKQDPTLSPRMLGIIEENAVRSLKMISEWSSSTSKIVPHPIQTNLAELINSIVIEANIPDNVKMQSYVGDGLESILIDPNIMRRVLDILVKNSVDSMPEGGRLSITAKKNGGKVEIKVSDTGTGISEELGGRVFSPRFTTKASGMGLGLMYCKKAVEAQGGAIRYDSRVNAGTTFILTLPLHDN